MRIIINLIGTHVNPSLGRNSVEVFADAAQLCDFGWVSFFMWHSEIAKCTITRVRNKPRGRAYLRRGIQTRQTVFNYYSVLTCIGGVENSTKLQTNSIHKTENSHKIKNWCWRILATWVLGCRFPNIFLINIATADEKTTDGRCEGVGTTGTQK